MSHNGKYLWMPYCRSSFDLNTSSPSALAIIDMQTDKVVCVMSTGPLPKYVAISSASRQAVVTHWGDNTLRAIGISADHPRDFRYCGHWVVERKLPTEGIKGNRESNCGFCLRGTVYTPDRPGWRGRYDLAAVVQALKKADAQRVAGPGGRSLSVGMGVRSIELSPDQRSLYAAINNDARLVQVDLASWSVVARSEVNPFTVGLAVSPDGKTIVTTSQERKMLGGHSVGFYRDFGR